MSVYSFSRVAINASPKAVDLTLLKEDIMANERERVGAGEPPEMRVVKLAPPELAAVVTKKATCPFLGSAIAAGELPVRNDPENPLAKVDDVEKLGNTGGGDLGKVLGFFARGNHGKMRGPTGQLGTKVPLGLFSLELPGSQGSHAGHSGILQGDPTRLDSGRFSEDDFDRFEALRDGGLIKRSAIARFIALNIKCDRNSQHFPLRKWAQEAADLFKAVTQSLGGRDQDSNVDAEIFQSLTSVTGGNHLLASSGEFGLLLAFLHDSPRTRHGFDPAFSMDEITGMFRDKKLPEGWKEWRKTSRDWLVHTAALAGGAAAELVRLKFVELLD